MACAGREPLIGEDTGATSGPHGIVQGSRSVTDTLKEWVHVPQPLVLLPTPILKPEQWSPDQTQFSPGKKNPGSRIPWCTIALSV
jgi:hypothetical protein